MTKKLLLVIAFIITLGCILTSCNNDVQQPAPSQTTQQNTYVSQNPSHTHSLGEWTVVREATCTQEGLQERVCSCGYKETKSIEKNIEHTNILNKIANSSYETSYQELYAIYTEILSHKKDCTSSIDSSYTAYLLENMLYGKWQDSNGNYIRFSYEYSNYNNTAGSTWYYTNLPSSKISGNNYYYYTKVENNNLIIGYEDTLTEERTNNFIITFGESEITVLNENNNKTYVLSLDKDYDKVQKGNARLAYIYIAKRIFDFKNPDSIKITCCCVNYETKKVYATIQATNSYGGTINTDYVFYESNGKYYFEKYSHDYSSNIDLSELNQKLQEYIATGGR